jgi:hypothetical protein
VKSYVKITFLSLCALRFSRLYIISMVGGNFLKEILPSLSVLKRALEAVEELGRVVRAAGKPCEGLAPVPPPWDKVLGAKERCARVRVDGEEVLIPLREPPTPETAAAALLMRELEEVVGERSGEGRWVPTQS